MYNTDNQQGPSVQHRKFGSIFWDKLCEKKNLIKSDYVYTYNWITLLYTWNEHNIVYQQYSNKI